MATFLTGEIRKKEKKLNKQHKLIGRINAAKEKNHKLKTIVKSVEDELNNVREDIKKEKEGADNVMETMQTLSTKKVHKV